MSEMRDGRHWLMLVLLMGAAATAAWAGAWPVEMHIYRGATPTLDGRIAPGEYDDAVAFTNAGWISQFNPITDPCDCSLRGWAKHDGRDFYFAFEVTDDILYGIDTERWLPPENGQAHELTREGFPWFGDGIELLINAAYTWREEDGYNNRGDGSCWQMVCNLTKSRLGGVGVGGLMEGEERVDPVAWLNYGRWIRSGAMEAVAQPKIGGGGFVIEWKVAAEPCLEVAPGTYWSPAAGVVRMGMNIALQDIDTPADGVGNFGNFDHEDWWAGEPDKRAWTKQWGTLVVHPGRKPHEVHVAPDGDDRGDGSPEAPLASLAAARRRVRELKTTGLDRDVLVLLHEGVYRLTEPLTFGPEDGGDAQYRVTYAAYPGYHAPGDAVTISGGRIIDGWQVNADGTWSANVPGVAAGNGWFRELFVNGRRCQRARYPNSGYLRTVRAVNRTDTIEFRPGDVPKPDDWQRMELVFIHDWSISRSPIARIDLEANTLTTARDAGFNTWWACLGRLPEERYYLENSARFLDAPGEWYLDETRGVLTYVPLPGEAVGDMTAVAPAAERLVDVQGDVETDRPVRNLHFRGLTFEHCAFLPPDRHYLGLQACYRCGSGEVADGSYTEMPGPEKARWGRTPAALVFEGAEDCTVRDGVLRHVGGTGVFFGRQCRDNALVGMHLFDIAANGVMIGEGLRDRAVDGKVWWKAAPEQAARGNVVRNNVIETCGQVYYGAVAAWVGLAADNRIEHNVIRELPYTGVSLGWMWGLNETPCAGNLVAYNDIHGVMRQLSDGAAIYMVGRQAGAVLRGNHVHDVTTTKTHAPNNGLRWDRGASEVVVEDNLVHGVADPILHFNPLSRYTLLRGNCFVPENVTKLGRYCELVNEKFTDVKLADKLGIVFMRNTIVEGTVPAAKLEQYRRSAGLEPAYRSRVGGNP